MTPQSEFEAVLTRTATLTSIIRTRTADEIRSEANGGSNGELTERVQVVATDLREAAAKLEAAIA